MPYRHTTTCISEFGKTSKALVAGQSVAAIDPFPKLTPERRADPMLFSEARSGEEPLEELLALLDGTDFARDREIMLQNRH